MPGTKPRTKTLGVPHFPGSPVPVMVHLFNSGSGTLWWMGQVRVPLCLQPRVFNILRDRPEPHIHGYLRSRDIHHCCSRQVLWGESFQWRRIGVIAGEHWGRRYCCWYSRLRKESTWKSTRERKKWWWNMIIRVIIKPLIINLLLFIKMGKKGGKSKGKPVVMTQQEFFS